jgi:NADH-quinone oxidoreductase subunit N
VVAVIGVLTSVVAAWYYINIIRVMFFEAANVENPVTLNTCYGARAVVLASLLFVVVYIIAPQGLATIASDAASSLFK